MKITEQVVLILEKEYDKKVNDIIYVTLTEHIHGAVERFKKGIQIKNPLLLDIKRLFKDEYEVSKQTLEVIKEEFGIDVNDYDFLGIRICNCNPTPNYKIKEFQFFYGLKTKQKLKEMNFKNSGNEVKSVLEINIDDFLSILMKEKNTITANEMLLDKQTRAGTYSENVLVSAEQIIPDYFRDKSILEKILTIKSMMQL